MTAIRTGGCQCGVVRYTLHGEPSIVGLCHCTTCRKISGSPFTAWAQWPTGAYTVAGEVQIYDRRSFCPVCGSRLFMRYPDYLEVMLGTLDAAPNALVPQVELWIKRREPWLDPLPGAAQHAEDRPKEA